MPPDVVLAAFLLCLLMFIAICQIVKERKRRS